MSLVMRWHLPQFLRESSFHPHHPSSPHLHPRPPLLRPFLPRPLSCYLQALLLLTNEINKEHFLDNPVEYFCINALLSLVQN